MKYNYLARTQEGELQTGTIEAADSSSALKTLQDHHLVVLKLKSSAHVPLLSRQFKLFQRVSRKDVFVFFRQLATLIASGVPLVQSLRSLAHQAGNLKLKEIISQLANDIDGGMAFSKALSRHPKAFSAFTISLMKSGEVSGQLQESLNYLADHLENEYQLLRKVRGAMVYPAFILGTFIIIAVLVMVMVIPNLTAFLTESGQELPWTTKLIIGASDFTRNWGWLVLVLFIIIGIFTWRYSKTEMGRKQLDNLKLKIPIFGNIFQKTYLARFAENLSALFKGGVSIIQSLNISGQVIGNAVYEEIIFEARDAVKVGRSMSMTLESHKEFPPLFCQMIKTGEQTGKLGSILDKLSAFYNGEVDDIVNNLTQLIEPILIIALGIGVAILVFAIYMPIYNMAGAF